MITLEALEVEPAVRAALEAYAEIAGTSVKTLVNEALADYVECVVQSRIEAMQQPCHSNVVSIASGNNMTN